MLGAIEGAAETTASLLKLASGWWSDRVKRRKPLVVAGYALASVVRPLVAAAQSAAQVLAIRLTDRVGKGIRSAPRDALIAESVDPSSRGRAFGFQRAADHAGAVVGPLVAFALLQWSGLEVRTVFWLAAIPAVLAVITVVAFVRETATAGIRGEAAAVFRREAPAVVGGAAAAVVAGEAGAVLRREAPAIVRGEAAALPKSFWAYLGVVLVFTLGNSTDAFLLLRAHQLGVPIALAPILWATLHLVKSVTSTYGGALSDRLGRAPTVIAGWTVYTLVYLGFALASAQWHVWALFVAYGLFFALTEGPERALVADFAPAARQGTAFGWFHLTIGLGMLPASLLFGLLWDRFGAPAAFTVGAALAGTASMVLVFLPRPKMPGR